MKKLLLLVIAIIAVSCSVGDDTSTNFKVIPIYQFDVPTTFKTDSVSIFKVRYKRESDCQIFNGIYFNGTTDDDIRIGIKVAELPESNCNPDGETVYEVPLYFKPTHSGTYVFNFWSGKDPNGEDHFSNTQIIVP